MLQLQHRRGHLPGDQRVAVAIASDPAPKLSGRAWAGSSMPTPRELCVQLVEQVPAHPAQQFLQE